MWGQVQEIRNAGEDAEDLSDERPELARSRTHQFMWVVVKMMVPFWIPILIRHPKP